MTKYNISVFRSVYEDIAVSIINISKENTILQVAECDSNFVIHYAPSSTFWKPLSHTCYTSAFVDTLPFQTEGTLKKCNQNEEVC